MTRDITVDDTEFAGAMKFRIVTVDVTNYDDDTGGDGEPLAPADVGMSRFQHVSAEVDPGATTAATTQVNAVAQFDSANDALRLFQQSDSGGTDSDADLVEVPSDANEGTVVNVLAVGR